MPPGGHVGRKAEPSRPPGLSPGGLGDSGPSENCGNPSPGHHKGPLSCKVCLGNGRALQFSFPEAKSNLGKTTVPDGGVVSAAPPSGGAGGTWGRWAWLPLTFLGVGGGGWETVSLPGGL